MSRKVGILLGNHDALLEEALIDCVSVLLCDNHLDSEIKKTIMKIIGKVFEDEIQVYLLMAF